MAANESVELAGPAGRLEAVRMHPEAEPRAAAGGCHAHPLHGGIMHFKPVFRAAKALQESRVATLRFNFRGVGRSEGAHDFGRGEQDDVRAALAEMQRRFPSLPLVLGGFSFGSTMALRVAAFEPAVRAVLALGYPLLREGESAPLESVRQSRLFVQGEHDQFGPAVALRPVVARLPPPRELVVIDGGDHYFTGRLEPLQQAIAAWAARRPWQG